MSLSFPEVIRCYMVKEDSQWIGVCIDFCLAVQADSIDEVKEKLIEQIKDHASDIFHAWSSGNMEQARYLSERKAPVSQQIKYFIIKSLYHLHQLKTMLSLDLPSSILSPKHC